MKKLSLVIAMILIVAFAGSAFAAQAFENGLYEPTTATGMTITGTAPVGSTFSGVYKDTKFKSDGKTNYPYEIYLPSEEHPESYRIHTSYTKNTDACAACHSTHTAVGGALLQWYTIYDTCMACHDGTVTTTYDVAQGKVGAARTMAAGGMFGLGGGSESSHNVTGAVTIAAAPGGSVVNEPLNVSGGHGFATEDRWVVEFGCESCHTPHGMGGNARILHPDPNYAASALAAANKWSLDPVTAAPIAGGGIGATIFGTATGTGNENAVVAGKVYFAFAPAANTAESAVYNVGNGFMIINNREWPSQFFVDGAKVSPSTTSTSWRFDNSAGYTRLVYMGTPSTYDATYANGVRVKVYGVPAIKVTMDIKNYLNQSGGTNSEKVTHVSGMNNYCGACHTDYNTASFEVYNAEGSFVGSSEIETGRYSKAHRHQFGRTYSAKPGLDVEDSNGTATGGTTYFTCLTCHVAHGTSKDYWTTSLVTAGIKGPNGDVWSVGELTELAGSSALKRMPNMGTCEACHSKQAGQEGYAANSSAGATPVVGVGNPVLSTPIWYIGEPIANAKANTWVGSAKCQPCHAEKVAGWSANKHKTASSIRTGVGCGSFNQDGTIMNCHQLGTTAVGLAPVASKVAENTAAKAAGSSFYYLTSTDRGVDSAVTCEACHGSAAQHVGAPSSTNIYNPGRRLQGETAAQAFERENKACGICHNDREVVNASTTVAQINDGTIHDGPSAYAQSKHFTSGLVGCPDCHDTHVDGTENTAITKLEYEQLCASCHGTTNLGSVADVMGGGADHTFTFGIAGATKLPDNAVATILPNVTGQYVTAAQVMAFASRRAAPVIQVKNAAGTQTYYSFTGGTWTLTPPAGALAADYTWDATRPRITFANLSGANLTRLLGEWKVSYVNTLNPLITAPSTTFLTVIPTGASAPAAFDGTTISTANLGSQNVPRGDVIKDGSTYKTWYHMNGNYYYATSSDGITWNAPTQFAITDAGDSVSVLVSGSNVYLFAADLLGTKINRYDATLAAPTTFSNPTTIISKGTGADWDAGKIDNPSMVYDAVNNKYRLYYQGYQIVTLPQTEVDRKYQIGTASSATITGAFTKLATPALAPNATTWSSTINGAAFDSYRVFQPYVVSANGVLYMFYAGNNLLNASGPTWIGVAWSSNGTSWTRLAGSESAFAAANGTGEPSGYVSGNTWNVWFLYGQSILHKTGSFN